MVKRPAGFIARRDIFTLTVNGRRYRQGRDLADKAARRRIRRWGRIPESVGKARTCPPARGVRRFYFFLLLLNFARHFGRIKLIKNYPLEGSKRPCCCP